MAPRFLDHPDPRVRRASAVVFAVATGAAVAAWFLVGGDEALGDRAWVEAAAAVVLGVFTWWIVGGVGLRIVGRVGGRVRERRVGDDR